MTQALGIVPFVVLLACIAVLPLVPRAADWWGKPLHQLGVSLLLGVPTAAWLIAGGEGELVTHTLHEYAGFIALLAALFVICGGIHLEGDLRAIPRNNTAFLALGGVLASLIGTTGASMLLIRPLLATNSERSQRAHTVVFSIFVMATAAACSPRSVTRHCSWACCAASPSCGRSTCSARGCGSTSRCSRCTTCSTAGCGGTRTPRTRSGTRVRCAR